MDLKDGAVMMRLRPARRRFVAMSLAVAFVIPCVQAAPRLEGSPDRTLSASLPSTTGDPTPTVSREASRVVPQEDRQATLQVFNRPIVAFRAPRFGTPPAERANRAAKRIDETLGQGGPGRVTAQPHPFGQVVLVDDRLAFILQTSIGPSPALGGDC